jgi:AcrR family transcriptional regulator
MVVSRTRGQRAGMTRDAILEAAIQLVDRDGLGGLSMRRLGAEVGVEAMTIYHHFTNKDSLLDGLVEHVFAKASLSMAGSRSWQARLRAYAHALRATLLEHPNLVPLVVSRPALTPQNLRLMEDAMADLRKAGFALSVALDSVYTLNEFVIGHVAVSSSAGAMGQAELLAAIDAAEYQLIAEATRAPLRKSQHTRFDFALDIMFSGLHQQLRA